MSKLQVVVIDDVPGVNDTVEAWLSTNLSELGVDDSGHPFTEVVAYPYETVEGFLAEVADDPGFEVDLVLVDLVIQIGGYGGLKALDALGAYRPDTPVLIYSSMENNGDRFMYALAAATWFTEQLYGIVPKRLGSGAHGSPANHFRHIVAGVLDGSYDDPTLEFLRSDAVKAAFMRLLDNEDDLSKWRAVQRHFKQRPASLQLGMKDGALRGWELERLRALDQLWDQVAQHTDLGGVPGQWRPDGDTHSKLRTFIFQQHAFFADPYLDEHFDVRRDLG